MEKWDKELVRRVVGRPRQPVPAFPGDHIPARLEDRGAPEDSPENEVEPAVLERNQPREDRIRSMYVTRSMIERYGYTPGCGACEQNMGGGT